jgi:hypothetical protein
MRIAFGPTKNEKEYAAHGWHKWFAWYPVRLAWRDGRANRGGVWLEWVAYHKKNDMAGSSIYDNGSKWEYRPLNEVQWIAQSGRNEFAQGEVK